ncbi:DUF423 domain-containing protein [Stenotrophobium rhamnosiphilum]|uniref:DUF423 domain-containing protein n=1 Tax=Stenotrophobium rhamnosiphilum TaxID=2029166 RepID=A0A2T5MDT1_9GAMM|nr:DUF423 domain-containing protein [Stenotrophobium rhamnosiphilum]PTU30745.1 DUF423 domain-containing protein [Stenotrophobium rhamnosiphilum]
MDKIWIGFGAAYGFLAVALGAFGAHALKQRLSTEMLAVWRTGVEYHFYHALALILLGIIARQTPSAALNAGGACFALGVLIFSGSLYALALSDIRILGAVTPLGGLLFLAGWILLGYAVLKS